MSSTTKHTSAKDDPHPTPSLKDRVLALQARFERTHLGRTLKQYADFGGNVLAGGIAYFSLTSIAAALVIAATVSSLVIGGSDSLRGVVLDFVDSALPGVVSANGDEGLVDEATLEPQAISGIIGIGAFLVLFFTATRYIGGLRQGVKVMLGNEVATGLEGKARDFIALFNIALLLLIGVILQVLASGASSLIAGALSDDPVSEWALRGPALGATLLVDAIFVYIALKVLGRSTITFRRLWPVLLVTAGVIGLLRLGSTYIIGGVADNAILGPFAAVVTVLIFADFVARAILHAAAWLGTRDHSELEEPQQDRIEGEIDEAGGPASEASSKVARA